MLAREPHSRFFLFYGNRSTSGMMFLEALEECRVLAVDRQDPTTAPVPGSEGELSCGDEAFLVREREVDAVFERPHRRRQAGEPGDRVQDDVRLCALEQLGQVAARLRQRSEAVHRLRTRRGRHELQLRVRVDDLARLRADRAGRAQEGDPLHGLSVGPGRLRRP